MNFLTDIKDEIARIKVEDMQEMISELAGFMPMCGRIHFSGSQKYCSSFTAENMVTSRRIFPSLEALYHDHITVEVRESQQLKKKNVYHIQLENYDLSRVFLDDIRFLKNGNIFMPNYEVGPYLVRTGSLKGAFLRDALLRSGILSNPSKTYHMELITSQNLFAQPIQSLLSTVHLEASTAKRKEEYMVYLKGAKVISDLLSLMESNQEVLTFEDVRVMKDIRNQASRPINCETTNLPKTINVVSGRIRNIKLIEERIGSGRLLDSLEGVAGTHLSNPSSSLKELGEKIHPTVGKSGVNYHLKKTQSVANKLRGKSK